MATDYDAPRKTDDDTESIQALQERTPEGKRGRGFATQFTFANLVSIIPLVFLSGLADLLGITNVVLITATIVLGTAYYARRRLQAAAASFAVEQDS